MNLEQMSETLRTKAQEKKMKEKEDETKNRMKSTLSKRDEAIRNIEKYQDKTGIPVDDEVDEHFISREASIDLGLEEFREKEDESEM